MLHTVSNQYISQLSTKCNIVIVNGCSKGSMNWVKNLSYNLNEQECSHTECRSHALYRTLYVISSSVWCRMRKLLAGAKCCRSWSVKVERVWVGLNGKKIKQQDHPAPPEMWGQEGEEGINYQMSDLSNQVSWHSQRQTLQKVGGS